MRLLDLFIRRFNIKFSMHLVVNHRWPANLVRRPYLIVFLIRVKRIMSFRYSSNTYIVPSPTLRLAGKFRGNDELPNQPPAFKFALQFTFAML